MLNIFKKPYNINIPSSILLKKNHTSKTKKKKTNDTWQLKCERENSILERSRRAHSRVNQKSYCGGAAVYTPTRRVITPPCDDVVKLGIKQ